MCIRDSAGIVFVVVAADQTVKNSVELKSIVSPPIERNYFTTRVLSVLPNITQSVIPAMLLCQPSELQTGCIVFTLLVNFDIFFSWIWRLPAFLFTFPQQISTLFTLRIDLAKRTLLSNRFRVNMLANFIRFEHLLNNHSA